MARLVCGSLSHRERRATVPLVAISIKLDKIDEESSLSRPQDGSYWLSCVCIFETDAKGRTIVAQSFPRNATPQERRAASRALAGDWRQGQAAGTGGQRLRPGQIQGHARLTSRRPGLPNTTMGRKGSSPRRKPPSMRRRRHNASRRQQITRTASMNPAFDMDATSRAFNFRHGFRGGITCEATVEEVSA